ncbi:molybdopterin-guanine dinucleotide biosynthesis protein B [Sneathiella sp. P13V-1]|uniref:molybdopterin-guanine dinucleotide biosynthesis protein B n=1 Tax=Sneathiella sp. P13V-1 TaxID=2697366 RepID=UPI00187BA12C|nr:molybdopterin-guanine dinucleotide biosynthesis protein B [Sneathiella sp. P13V-1]MBE7638057.1 molybdopterin-guanine dinucleotide biosynthesis protein B [Sneathiella sp. P13V-1]
MKIVGISGWSGNGKTTLLVQVIPALIARGYTVSSVKHAHHNFDVDTPGKDSYRHREAGAKEVMVASAARWALMHENREEDEPGIYDLIKHMTPVDILLVEGFKREDFPKIEVWRDEGRGEPLHRNDKTVVAVATNDKNLQTSLPVLDLEDAESIADFIVEIFLKEDVTR